MDPGSIADSCDYEKADSTERLFMVNVHIARGLSFAQAKVLDAAWDTAIGQAGQILHGWLLYHVAIGVLTWICEHFSAPYDLQLRLRFDTVSTSAIYTVFLFIFRGKKPARISGLAFWLLGSLLYVVFFPTIWGTATRYYQPSSIAYTIPEIGPGVFRHQDFRECWVTDLNRVEPNHNGVIIGSPVSGLHETLGFKPTLGAEASEEYRSLSAYAATMQSIRRFYPNTYLPPRNVSLQSRTNPEITSRSDIGGGFTANWLEMSCDIIVTQQGTSFPTFPHPLRLDSTIYGWQYGIKEQLKTQNLSSIPFRTDASTSIERVDTPPEKDGFGTWDIFNAPFILDKKLAGNPGIVPYNSSFWWRRESIPISAPFLQFGETRDGIKCSSEENENDICICVNDNPIPWDTIRKISQNKDDLFCVGGQEYVWGFSSRLSLLGALFECLWILSCVGMWNPAGRSNMARCKRPCAGVARSIIDMAPAMQRDLGDGAGTYGDKELVEELRKYDPVGYVLDEQEGGKTGIRMRSISGGMGKRRDMARLDGETLYS